MIINAENAKNILIIRLGALGDNLLWMGAIQDIREQNPSAKMTILTNPQFSELFSKCPFINEIIYSHKFKIYNYKSMIEMYKKLTEPQFDFVHDLQSSDRSYLYCLLLGKTKIVSRYIFASHRYKLADNQNATIYERMEAQIKAAGLIPKHTFSPDISWMSEICALPPKPYVFLVPGASKKHPLKRWGQYKQLAEKLTKINFMPVTAPGPDEMELCTSLPATALTHNGKPLSIFQLVYLAQNAAFTIGNDTGPTHIAALTKGKGIALFSGETSPSKTGLDKKFTILQSKNINDITVEEVFSKFKTLI